jgi:KaiC/GvpD/RAD55 family RecA-like ATPase
MTLQRVEPVTTVARVRSYVYNLDEQMEGGVPKGSVVLVCGRPGSMKSSLTYFMMHMQAVNEGRRSVYFTLEQSRASFARHLAHIGLNPDASDKVTIIDVSTLRRTFGDRGLKGDTNWLEAIVSQAASFKSEYGCEIVAIDSMSALYSLHEFENPRRELFHFFEGLRALGVTIFLISEMYDPTKEIFARYEVEDFLADGVIHLKVDRRDGGSNLYLGIVKMRETRHSRDYFPLIVEPEGFEVVPH